MTTLELGVLVAAVVLVAVVWLIPLDRHPSPQMPPSADDARGGDQSVATPESNVAEPVASVVAAPVALTVPVAFTTMSAVVDADGSEPTVSDERFQAPDAAPAAYQRRTSTANLAVAWTRPDGRRPARVVRSPASGSGLLASTATNPVAGGAASRSAYPMAIPIPVNLSVAPPPIVTPEPEQAADVLERSRPYESNSAASSAITWSPEIGSANATWLLPELRRGSQSIVARVSSVEPATRRNLAIAAGAGVLLALAVARR